MADRNLEVALRIKADMADAAKQVQQVDAALDQLGATGRDTATGLDATGKAADKAAAGLDKEAAAAEKSTASRRKKTKATRDDAGAEGGLETVQKRRKQTEEQLSLSAQRLATEVERTAAATANAAAANDRAALAALRLSEAQQRATLAHGRLAPAVARGAAAMRQGGLSAGEYRQAMRQVPAQMTDIVTSLISGQPAYLVAIQQGGQLKDSFGGVGAAARALLGAISPTVVGVAAGAGAFALIGKALFDGYQEMQRYEQALISTGNAVGLTAGQLSDLADRVGATSNAYGDAETAAALLAASGKLTGTALEDAARAAVALAQLTGEAIESTTDKIIKLAGSPIKAMEELNAQYHFLTAAQYEEIRALDEQGRSTDATNRLLQILADTHEQRVTEMQARAGSLETAWRAVRNTIAEAWDNLKQIGKDNPEADLRAAQAQLDFLLASRSNFPGDAQRRIDAAQAEVDRLQARVKADQDAARADADAAAATEKAIAAAKAQRAAEADWERLRLANLDRAQKLEQEIADIRKTGLAAGKSEADIEAQIAAARERAAVKPRKARKSEAQQAEEAAQRELANLTKQAALLGAVEAGQKRVSEEARVRYEIDSGGLAAASAGTRQQLIDQAKLLDAKRAEQQAEQDRQREFDKTEKAYDSLRGALATPAEAAVDKAIEQIRTLNAALKQGTASADAYDAQVGQIISAAFTAAPSFAGLSPEIGGIDSEQFRLDQATAQLDTWYQDQLSRLAAFRAQKADLAAQWDATEQALQAEHQAKLDELATAQSQLTLTRLGDAFGAMAETARNAAGEQSAAYRALFAISKGFAAAEATLALGRALSDAMAQPWPWSMARTADVLAQFANISSIIASATLGYAEGGRIRGPGTSTSDSIPIWASDQEFMVRAAAATQPGAPLFLEDFNRRGMVAIADWRGLADGGFVGAAEPRAALSAGPSVQSINKNNMRVYVFQDEDQLAARLAQHPAMEKAIVVAAVQNGGAIQAQW